jgi:hypothetical protein
VGVKMVRGDLNQAEKSTLTSVRTG